jgi:S1-C subfamily serine protease
MASDPEYPPPYPEPVAVAPPPPPPAPRRGGAGVGTIAVIALVMGLLGGLAGGYVAGSRISDRPGTPARISVPGLGAGLQPVVNTLTEDSAVIRVAEKAGPAVVEIRTRSVDPDIFSARQQQGIGSGFIVDARGYIVTNNHVIANAQQLKVILRDVKTPYDAKLVGTDREDDIAVIKIDPGGKDLPFLTFGDSNALKVGQLAIAIGSPLGRQNSVSRGIISALHRNIKTPGPLGNSEVTILNVIQTDATINPGNSGGPLLNSDGKVVGVNFAIEQAQRGAGLGLALEGNGAHDIADQLIRNGKITTPTLGVVYQILDQTTASALNLPVGAQVKEVLPGSPAERAGLKAKDVITQLNDISIDDEHPLKDVLRQRRPGDTVTIQLQRGDKRMTVQATLGQPSG